MSHIKLSDLPASFQNQAMAQLSKQAEPEKRRKPSCLQKATLQQLIEAYSLHRNVWKVAEAFGMCGQSVYKRLKKTGVIDARALDQCEKDLILETYRRPWAKGDGVLDALALQIGMHKTNVCRTAKNLGLTIKRRQCNESQKEAMAIRTKLMIQTQGHPRGMLGKHHSEETKERISEAGIGRVVPYDVVLRSLKTRALTGSLYRGRQKCSWKQAWREIGSCRIYARSRWEANYARYLQWMQDRGEVCKWEHEPKTFWFEKIKRGCMSYLPDFRVTFHDGRHEYHEVKGWMDARSKTKLDRMRRYYPQEKIVLIQADWFRTNGRTLSKIIPGWEV